MKLKIILTVTCCLCGILLFGQNLVAVTSWGNTQVGGDSLLYRVSLDEPVSFLDDDQALVISTQPIFYVIAEDTTAINQIELLTDITVFPNPTSGIANVNRSHADEDYHMEIIAQDGKVLRQITWHAGASVYQVSFQSLPQGMYLLNVHNAQRTKHQSFKIQKK